MGNPVKTASDPMKTLLKVPASDVKRRGWRGIMRTLGAERAVVVTNHQQAEAVILTAQGYAELLERANQADLRVESDLALLRSRFDERLAALQKPDAGDRLRSVMRGPSALHGKVKAGGSY